jgi:hypothetical protein
MRRNAAVSPRTGRPARCKPLYLRFSTQARGLKNISNNSMRILNGRARKGPAARRMRQSLIWNKGREG